VIAYDLYGIPLPQYVNDENVIRNYSGSLSSSASTLSSARSKDSAPYEYSIRLTVNPQKNDNRGSSSSSKETELVVTGNNSGYILVRLVHPIGADTLDYSQPTAASVAIVTSSSNDKLKSQ
jgi:hypothetical protein